ncbi:GNAT family N-acetyltransferase [Streptococcus anginosus]|uniref:GNAT family N-acetyltransferase n=1 Tax=Streptococcus anginosus TaxID=1328 RepID=UPI001C8C24CC|nr:GNAT family N-acetyltransferase [Streptococcus anginosus]MBX9101024.1 GNAT family N-acetyltransferase [Streptococcus anginosus]
MIDVKKQPEYISIDSSLRLRKYDGQAHLAFSWYQDLEVIRLIDGSREPCTLQRIKKMYDYLTHHGEVYFIEVLTNAGWQPIGDVSFWQEDMPIVIGNSAYRGQGIGRTVVQVLIERGRKLGYKRLYVQEIYDDNEASKKMFESVGFYPLEKTENGHRYALDLTLPLSAIQPSQFYLSEKKLEQVQTWFDIKDINALKPLPIKRLKDKIFFTDGHSRVFIAYQAGFEEIPVYAEEDDLNWDFYYYCLQTCEEKGILTIKDLENRILPESDYRKKWLDWCQRSRKILKNK